MRNDPAPDLDEMAALAELPPLAESWRQAYRSRREYLLQRAAD
ncbi:MAG: 3-alpha domain-containing protein [Salinisphaeraceae bacterium]